MEGSKKISQFDPAESFSADDFISGIQKVTDSEYKNVKIPRSVLDSLYYLASNPSNYISGITKAMVENALTGNEITSHYHDGRYSQLGHEHTFASLTSKPTTLAGYGITDAYTQSYINSNFINTDQKGAANGVATLDAGGKVPSAQLPSTLLIYKGVWNPVTNTPTLLDIDGSKAGFVYNVGTAGSQFGINWNLGDWAIYNDLGILEKSDNSDDVVSVNGKQGAVTLNTDDIDELASSTNLYFTDARARSAISLTTSGTSGAATYTPATGVLNIPQYQAALTNPVTGTGSNTMIPYWTGEHTLGYDPTFSINTTTKYVTTKGLIADDGANGGLVIVGSGNGVSSDGTGGRDFSFRQENSVDGIIWIGSRGNVLVTLDMLNEGTGKSFTIQNHGRKGGGTPLFSVDDAGLVTVPASLKVNTFNGMLKATNGVISEAVAGTDYANYTFGSGTTNGAFSVTPSGGSAQSVAIYGLDTAAYRKAQTSATDTTANSLMQVGAFGLGAGSTQTIEDLNTLSNSGFYRWVAGGSNYPPSGSYGALIHMSYTNVYAVQLGSRINATNADLYVRRNNNGSWNTWQKLYHTGNLVNPVTGTGTAGQISYWNGTGSQAGSANLVWDNANGILSSSKIAIGKTSVTSGYMLDVNGAIISSGNIRGASYNVGTTSVIDASRNASFANLTATGTTTLATSLTGLLKATSGVVSAGASSKDLGDMPSTLTAGKWLKVNAGSTAYELVDGPSGIINDGIFKWDTTNNTYKPYATAVEVGSNPYFYSEIVAPTAYSDGVLLFNGQLRAISGNGIPAMVAYGGTNTTGLYAECINGNAHGVHAKSATLALLAQTTGSGTGAIKGEATSGYGITGYTTTGIPIIGQAWTGTVLLQLKSGSTSVFSINNYGGIEQVSSARNGFYGSAAITKPTVTGSRGGNAALASLLTALANLGLITDSTSA